MKARRVVDCRTNAALVERVNRSWYSVVSQFEYTRYSRPRFREGRLRRESRLFKMFWVPAFARTTATDTPLGILVP